MKNPTILSLAPAQSLQCQLYVTSTFRRDQPRDWKCYEIICGEVSYVEDSSGGNYKGQGRGFTTGRQHEETRFHQSGLVGGTRLENDFNSGSQPVGLGSDKGAVQAASEAGNVTVVTFADNCIVEGAN